jgi:catechol 2,3-dioxygenase-like lactoylglutathione lyase family enzyme
MVSNRKRSVDWYTRKLGFDVIQEMGHWLTVGRKGENGTLHLCQVSDLGFRLEKGSTGINLHLSGEFFASCEALRANGVRFTHPPKQAAWGAWATIADPDGNVIDLRPED